jgi:hypothetical protein
MQRASCHSSLPACREALDFNGNSPVLQAKAFADHMEKAGSAMLVLIGPIKAMALRMLMR